MSSESGYNLLSNEQTDRQTNKQTNQSYKETSFLPSWQPELSGCITSLTVRNTGGSKLYAAMDTLIDQDAK